MNINILNSIRSKSYFLLLLPIASLLLTACTTTDRATTGEGSATSPYWHTQQQQLKQITHYEARGSFAYLGESRTYAKFFWKQSAINTYHLQFTNPLGIRELELNVSPQLTQLIDKNGKIYRNTDPSEIIYQLTGMEIPLNNLTDWLLGLPGTITHYTLDENHLLKSLIYEKNGEMWQVNYQTYDTTTTPSLPSRLELTQGKQRIKVKIDHWTLNK